MTEKMTEKRQWGGEVTVNALEDLATACTVRDGP